MKQKILGTALGRLALRMRDRVRNVKTLLFEKEAAGTISNDLQATFLTTRLCRPNMSFIDVGAHIGSIVSEVSHYDETVKIIAVEAMPEKVMKLRQKFPSIEVHDCAVGEIDNDEISFYVNSKATGYSSLARPSGKRKSSTVEIRVAIRKLDNLISANDVDVIKIDVEGTELGVLRGGRGILTSCRPVIMFESGPSKNDGLGYLKEDMWNFLTENKYEVFVPNRVAHNGPGLSCEGFCESHLYPRRTTNYFAVPIERREEIRDLARSVLKIEIAP